MAKNCNYSFQALRQSLQAPSPRDNWVRSLSARSIVNGLMPRSRARRSSASGPGCVKTSDWVFYTDARKRAPICWSIGGFAAAALSSRSADHDRWDDRRRTQRCASSSQGNWGGVARRCSPTRWGSSTFTEAVFASIEPVHAQRPAPESFDLLNGHRGTRDHPYLLTVLRSLRYWWIQWCWRILFLTTNYVCSPASPRSPCRADTIAGFFYRDKNKMLSPSRSR